MNRLVLAVLFGVATAGFAAAMETPLAWILVGVALCSVFWRRDARSWSLVAARRALYLAIAGTVLYGWVAMAYPVMSPHAIRRISIVLGYWLAITGSLCLLAGARPWATAIPASVALLAVSGFNPGAVTHPYLITTGVAAFVLLAMKTIDTERRLAGLVTLGIFGLAALGVGWFTVITLPWAQTRIEQAMVSIYTPSGGGPESQHRARLGELQSLKLSDKVVMRVWSQRPQRLRSRVLVRFDGAAWHRDIASIRSLQSTEARLSPLDREFTESLPGSDFLLHGEDLNSQQLIRTRVVRTNGKGLVTAGGTRLVHGPMQTVRVDDADVVSIQEHERVRTFGILHELNHQRAQRGPLSPRSREATLQLPDSLDPRIAVLAAAITSSAENDEAAAELVVSHLRTSFSYSLEVSPAGNRDPIADFLFEKKQGWCEYFAGSAAILLRTRGIPTRYVRGFNVIGSQKKWGHYVVREWDRHAWIEAYIEGKGWLEYDPTPAAEFEQLHAGLDNGALSDAVEWLSMQFATMYAAIRHLEWKDLRAPLAGLIGLVAAIAAARHLRRRLWFDRRQANAQTEDSEDNRLDELVQSLDLELQRIGCPRPPNQAPLEHWASVPEQKMPAGLRETGLRILRAYYLARFGARRLSETEIDRLLSEIA